MGCRLGRIGCAEVDGLVQALDTESARCKERLSDDQTVLRGTIAEISLAVSELPGGTDLAALDQNCAQVG